MWLRKTILRSELLDVLQASCEEWQVFLQPVILKLNMHLLLINVFAAPLPTLDDDMRKYTSLSVCLLLFFLLSLLVLSTAVSRYRRNCQC